MSSIEETVETLRQDFDLLGEWEHRYEYIIDLGKELPAYPEEWQTPEFEIFGCQSRVWIHPEQDGALLRFSGSSDSVIVKGLVGLILKVYSGRTPQEILSCPPDFIRELGLEKHLMSTRLNGLNELLKRVFVYAQAFQNS